MRAALAGALLAFAAVTARALPLLPDPTGLWYDPNQPGYGLEIAQQNETIFAVLFMYDPQHRPTWYVASNMAGTDFRGLVYTGTLYRTTGPAFSAATFDPGAVTVTAVGSLQISYTMLGPVRRLQVNGTIDGAAFGEILLPQTWSQDPQDLLGGYGGQFFFDDDGSRPSSCPPAGTVALPPSQPNQPYEFSVAAGNAPGHVNIAWGSGIDIGCSVDATYSRAGLQQSLTGTLACGPIGSPPSGSGAPLTVQAITSNAAGFFGAAHLTQTLAGGVACDYYGNFGGVLRDSQPRRGMIPDPTGVWFLPEESGWGLILTQQGANIFAGLFAYGADGKPAWWVASNVVDSGQHDLLQGEIFAGTLYATTGPDILSLASQPALAATAVGTVKLGYPAGSDKLLVTYTVGGTTVTKTLQRESWSSDVLYLAPLLTGGLFPAQSTACGSAGLFASQPGTLVKGAADGDATHRLSWRRPDGFMCEFDATYSQAGQFANLAGPVSCGTGLRPYPAVGSISVSSGLVTIGGFAAFANFTSGNCTTGGYIGGVAHFQ